MAVQTLIPVRKCNVLPGRFEWGPSPVLASSKPADLVPLAQLAGDLRRGLKLSPSIQRNAFGPAQLRLRRDGAIGPESYRLCISPDAIEITSGDDAGAYYAIQTLRDIVAVQGRRLGACVIDDRPDFRRRGVYHDISRGKVPTLATLKALVERLAHWKINELQLYVENVFQFRRHPQIGKGYSPMTPADMLELQDHCRTHHVKLVGSLASFGHMEKILQLPRYAHLAEQPEPAGIMGLMSLCPVDPAARAFIAELYEEFVPLFEAEDFNVCCDETVDLGQGRSRSRAARVGAGRVYLDFLLYLRKLCHKHGKRLNAWSDIILEHADVLPAVPRDIVMLNWDYDIRGARIARSREITDAGLSMLACPGTNGWQSHGTRLSEAICNVAQFSAEARRRKAQGLLNTDWGDFGHRNFLGVSLHSFAHGAAHAWYGAGVDDGAFTEAFCRIYFGQKDGRLARAIRRLGDSYMLCSQTPSRNADLYWALVEPLVAQNPLPTKGIHNLRPAGLRQIIGQLEDESIWPAAPKACDEFERLAFEEFKVAAQMETLACRRGLAALELRSGRTLSNARLKVLAADAAATADRFARLWMARNKVSRLKDNMNQFKAVQREAVELSRK